MQKVIYFHSWELCILCHLFNMKMITGYFTPSDWKGCLLFLYFFVIWPREIFLVYTFQIVPQNLYTQNFFMSVISEKIYNASNKIEVSFFWQDGLKGTSITLLPEKNWKTEWNIWNGGFQDIGHQVTKDSDSWEKGLIDSLRPEWRATEFVGQWWEFSEWSCLSSGEY